MFFLSVDSKTTSSKSKFIARHFKKETIIAPPGVCRRKEEAEERSSCQLCQLAASKRLMLAVHWEWHTIYSVLQAVLSIYLKERCQRYSRGKEDWSLPLTDAQLTSTHISDRVCHFKAMQLGFKSHFSDLCSCHHMWLCFYIFYYITIYYWFFPPLNIVKGS